MELKVNDIVTDKNRNLGRVLSIFDDIRYNPYTYKKYNSLSAAVHFFETKTTWVTNLSELQLSLSPRFQKGDMVTLGFDSKYKVLDNKIGNDCKLYYIVEYITTINGIDIAIQDIICDNHNGIELYVRF